MRLLAGTSGYSYKEWKGTFYPADLPASEMLPFYASRLPAVEINNTFYRMPRPEMLASWAERVPDGFRFALKASQRITHFQRLREASDLVDFFFRSASTLGDRLGPVLFQLPPNFQKDLPRLAGFLDLLPPGPRCAFEFRHASWFDGDVFALLRERSAALCVAEDEGLSTPLEATTGWGYLRLRRQDYGSDELKAWIERLRGQPWTEGFVFFKHEEEGRGPALAAEFSKMWGSSNP